MTRAIKQSWDKRENGKNWGWWLQVFFSNGLSIIIRLAVTELNLIFRCTGSIIVNMLIVVFCILIVLYFWKL